MDEAARQTSSHSLSSASSFASSATMRRPGSSQRQHRRTGSVGTVSEHEVRAELVLHHNISVTKATKEKRKKEVKRQQEDGVSSVNWSSVSDVRVMALHCSAVFIGGTRVPSTRFLCPGCDHVEPCHIK